MKSIRAAYLALALLCKVTEAFDRCKPDEVQICFAKYLACFCEKCLICPPGYGPSHHCGGQYNNGTVITCKTCIEGKDYSENSSISSCQPCAQCDGKKTLRKCTATSSSICSFECRVGYKMDYVVDDCVRDPAFTPHPMTTSTKRTTIRIKLSNELPSTSTNKLNNDASTKTISEQPYKTSTLVFTTRPTEIGLVIILVSIVLGIAGLAIIYFMVKKLRTTLCVQHGGDGKNDESIGLTAEPPSNASTARSSEESIGGTYIPAWQWPDGFLFKDIPPHLTEFLAVKISQPNIANGWRKIGEELGVEELELDRINLPVEDGQCKGGSLFEYLKARNPRLTLSKVVSVLQKVGKYDLVEKIQHDWYGEPGNTKWKHENCITTNV